MTETIEQIRDRFEPNGTKGGHEYEIFVERDGELWGRINDEDDCWVPQKWGINGIAHKIMGSSYDLIPKNPHAELVKEASRLANVLASMGCTDNATTVRALVSVLEQKETAK